MPVMSKSVRVDALVVATMPIEADGVTHARPNDLGVVVGVYPNRLVTVRWLRTGTVCDAEPGVEFLEPGDA